MAGRRFPLANPRSIAISKPLTFLVALLSLAFFFLFFFLSPSNRTLLPHQNRISDLNLRSRPPDRSFLVSFEKFLASRFKHVSSNSCSAPPSSEDDVTAQNDWNSVLRVYVYDMPDKFTYDLLRLFRDTYKETYNLTSNGSPVHRLIEQHSVDYWLWADLIAPESERLLKNVKRVYCQEEADVFYIPFFTTISYFLLERQQCKALYREALKWVTDQPAWNRSGGWDHILPVHHPWSFKSVRRFMKHAMWLLPDMDSTGNWYKPGEVCLAKDIILPYVSNVELCDTKCVTETQNKRSILLFFRGRLKRNAGGKIRSKLVEVLRDEKGVIIEEGTSGEQGKAAAQSGMRKSLFCLSPAGDTPSSARLFDAIVSGCIPVVVSDELDPPFESKIDYTKILFFVSSSDAVQPGWLVKFLIGIDSQRIRNMQANLAKYSRHFIYSSPAQPLGPEDLTWQMVAGRLSVFKLYSNKSRRLVPGSRMLDICKCSACNVTRVRSF